MQNTLGRRIGHLAVVTADRPALLRRCLAVLSRLRDRDGRRPRVAVIDGSRSPSALRANRALVRRLGDRGWYVGPSEVAKLVDVLIKGGFDGPAVRLGLGSRSAGANRNVALLLANGCATVMVDDDVVAQGRRRPGPRGPLAIGGHDLPPVTAFFASRETALQHVVADERTILDAHGAVLGVSLSALKTQQLNTQSACRRLVAALEAEEELVVGVTMAGLVGDAGVNCGYSWLLSHGLDRRVLQSDPWALHRALHFREVVRHAPQDTVVHRGHCMAYCLGLDTRLALPPFLPLGRNEDGVFGYLLERFQPHVLFAHLDYAVVHDSCRPARRQGAPRPLTRLRLSELVIDLASASARTSRHVPSVETLGEHLVGLGALPPRALDDCLRSVATVRRGRMRALVEGDVPSRTSRPWQAAVAAYVEALEADSRNPVGHIPSELITGTSSEDCLAAVARFLREFGSLLIDWQDMGAHIKHRSLCGESSPCLFRRNT